MYKVILFDWGDTIMRDFTEQKGAMYKWNYVEKMPNVGEMLITISKTVEIYMATNAADSTKYEIIEALKRVELDHFFIDIFCYKEIGFKKPSKEYFETVLSRLNVKNTEILIVGDNLENDITGAANFGIDGILYDWKNQYPNYKGKKIMDLIELSNKSFIKP